MRPDLTRFIQELRNETCPQRVLDEVQRRTSVKARPPARLRWTITFAATVLVLVGGLLGWRWRAGESSRQQARMIAQASADRARVVRQTEDALGWMGSVLASAGTRSEKIISDEAGPPLRASFQITKNKIIPNSDL